jgi:hypothetical protein
MFYIACEMDLTILHLPYELVHTSCISRIDLESDYSWTAHCLLSGRIYQSNLSNFDCA